MLPDSAPAGGRADVQPGQPAPKTYQSHVQPKGGKPLWVLNGRVYNYRKEGATPVPNEAAAEEVIAAERDAIQGLGAGGNKFRGEESASTQWNLSGQVKALHAFKNALTI